MMILENDILTRMADQGINYLKYHEPRPVKIMAYEGDAVLFIPANGDDHASKLLFSMTYGLKNAGPQLNDVFNHVFLHRIQKELDYTVYETPQRPNGKPETRFYELKPPR